MKPKKHDKAIAKDPVEWGKSVEKEHEQFEKGKVAKETKRKDSPPNAKKQKANGDKRVRLDARGFDQVEGVHNEVSDE